MIAAGGVLLLLVLIAGVLWMRCGVRGCPDVDMLKGYMPDEASVILDRNGDEVSKLFVTRRVVVPVDSMPEHLLNAFVAIEDRRFWSHGGVDWRRVAGAALQNVKAGGIEEGSSTITMQLARNVFPEQLPANQKTLWRKLGEARVARSIERRYSKREILELYLNQIYFGSGAYGIQSAAEEYFGKSASGLTLAESALLAALPRAPSRLNPRANADAALEGRELVLSRMAGQGLITQEELAEATEAGLVLRERRTENDDPAPYFVEEVRRILEDQLGTALYTEGYTIHTTLDLRAQAAAEQELTSQLTAIESGRYGSFTHTTYGGFRADSARDASRGTPYLQGAMIVMDARTGDVLALIGGRDYEDSQFNRATQAMRQPGSAFKPFVYAAAISAGYSPAHRLMDRPLRYVLDNGRIWEPSNYDGTFSGVVTMRQALTHSKNVATVRLANEVGMSRVIGTAEQFGLGRVPSNPSVVLGTAEVTPLQLTAAFGAFATLGQRPEPRFVTRVVSRSGGVVWQQQPGARRVIDPAVAFITTSLMQDVVDRGTGTAVRGVGFRGAAAGKTGTTQDAADVWFVGFTPELVATVWIGLDRRERIIRGATGGELAAPVWGRVMRTVSGATGGWSAPAGVEQLVVDENGAILAQGCAPRGATRNEFFLRGTAPMASCYPDSYAYADSFGWDQYEYDELRDTVTTATTDTADGWWNRLRRRWQVEDDSLRRARPTVPATGVPPGTPTGVPPGTTTGVPPATGPDTTARRDTSGARAPRPLGRPVDSVARPPVRDTIRRDTIPGAVPGAR
jgi:1A family penicillin-binding protein